jgi:histidinol-phosphatase (PHP family)
MILKTNWHTHTKRCGHAIGEDEEYVQAAIKAGFHTLGFSDHAAYRTPLPTDRMNIDQVPDYYSSILALKEKYKDQLAIHLGMEVECYQSEWDTLMKYRKDLEYCILGQHTLTIDGESSYRLHTSDGLKKYTDQLEYACEHSLCDYIAHPDVCLWSYPCEDGAVRETAERIADISVHYNIPLELNAGSGVREGKKQYDDGLRYAYPNRIFFEAFAERHCRIVPGLDIHDPKLFLTDEYIKKALDVVSGLNLNIIDDFDILSEAAERKKLAY